MKEQYMIYHPPTNSSPYRAFCDKDHFRDLNDKNFTPILYKTLGAAKAAITFALRQAKYGSPHQLEELRSFLIEAQVVVVDFSIKKVVYECLFDITKIAK